MQWLVHQVLRAGQRSPRVMALAALHLAPLFLACPPAALFYQQLIKKLLLFDAKHASLSRGMPVLPDSELVYWEVQRSKCTVYANLEAAGTVMYRQVNALTVFV